jgi:hypothetical protein
MTKKNDIQYLLALLRLACWLGLAASYALGWLEFIWWGWFVILILVTLFTELAFRI